MNSNKSVRPATVEFVKVPKYVIHKGNFPQGRYLELTELGKRKLLEEQKGRDLFNAFNTNIGAKWNWANTNQKMKDAWIKTALDMEGVI